MGFISVISLLRKIKARQAARKIKLVLMDVDGTLTDGLIYILPDGQEVKGYHVTDGLGILLAKLAGLKTGIITGKHSEALSIRASKLRFDEVHQDILDKKKVFSEILVRHKLHPEEVAFIGDDLGDLEVMKSVGLAAAPADAHPEIKRCAMYMCRKKGGRGAVREFLEFILKSQKKWTETARRVAEIKKSSNE